MSQLSVLKTVTLGSHSLLQIVVANRFLIVDVSQVVLGLHVVVVQLKWLHAAVAQLPSAWVLSQTELRDDCLVEHLEVDVAVVRADLLRESLV